MKYAHLTIEVRLVGHGVQVDMFDRTLASPDGQGIRHRTEVWDFADSKPIVERVQTMIDSIYIALRKVD